MAVYTQVSVEEARAFLKGYDVGDIVSFKGIAEGSENSNFLLQTTKDRYILTLYEVRVNKDDLPFFLNLKRHLHKNGLPCPLPVVDRDGAALQRLNDRPAALISFLPGVSVSRPTPHHCREAGRGLAQLHAAAADFPKTRENDLSVEGWARLAGDCAPNADQVSPGLADAIDAALTSLESAWPQDLPRGVTHSDYFPDNVFFLNDAFAGVIDFYFACTDFLAYDLAVALNAWCFDDTHQFSPDCSAAFIEGYEEIRSLTDSEKAALPVLCQGAALRFLLTRLYDWLHTEPSPLVHRKDPLAYSERLKFHQTASPATYFGA